MNSIEVLAPAKVNLTLHVTGQRADGYHLLDSLVVFADVGDRLLVKLGEPALTVSGPMAQGVPTDGRNLVLKAAALMQTPAQITLEKHLPAAAGIGGGSSDAAAVLRALQRLTGRNAPLAGLALGADVPVCMQNGATIMRGIGEVLEPAPDLPDLHAVLVNPGVEVPTGAVFDGLARKDNPPMEPRHTAEDFMAWLGRQRNDLEPPACAVQPVIQTVLDVISQTEACQLARMSGSGATCFGLYPTAKAAQSAAKTLHGRGWWVQAANLR
jgi:4-diphosphocytidyl-2-C-methyl-D-erythritol kinase